METILEVADSSRHRESFENERISCLYIKNPPFSPLILAAEDKFVEGKVALRIIDVRVSKRRALMTVDGFPLSIMMPGSGNDIIKYGGLVLEQEYGGGYTGNVSYIDPVNLLEGVVQLDRWRVAIAEAGYIEAAANPANVMHMTNRYAFEEELKLTFSNTI
jgi:hypothetical protein